MKNSLLLSIFLFTCFFIACHGQKEKVSITPKNFEPQIDTIFKEVNDPNIPGVAVAVLQNGEMIFQKAYGSAHLEKGTPLSESSVFTLASVSKQFTVLAIMLLADQKQLSLDDDIRKYIPELPDYGHTVTLRHLASNSSGMRSDLQLLGMTGITPDDLITAEMVQQITFQQKELNFPPGTEFSYSNSGFVLLAEVVARISGQKFSTFMEQQIFQPLGMHHTFVMDDAEKVVDNLAPSYAFYNNAYHEDIMRYSFFGSTGVFTTVNDFGKWARNFSDPKVGNQQIFKAMNTPFVLNNGQQSIYGLGQFIEDYKGLSQIQHGGGSASYRTYIGRFPEQGLTVLVLSNNGTINSQSKALAVADLFLQPYFEQTTAEPKAEFIQLPTADLAAFSGSYLHAKNYYVRTIAVHKDTLIYTRPEQGNRASPLFPITPTQFQLGEWEDTQVQFKQEKDVQTMHILIDGKEVDVLAQFTPKTYTSKALQAFIGTYYSEELQTTYTLKLNKGILSVEHPKLGNIHLNPIQLDAFLGTSWQFNFLQFERNAANEIEGFRLSSDRAKNILFSKV